MKTLLFNLFITMAIVLSACGSLQNDASKKAAKRNKEARHDDDKMADALAKQAQFTNIVSADVESDAVPSKMGADAADDPAIWVNTKKPEESLVIGTNKKGGLHVYNLKGKELQFVRCGKMNNVDLRDGFMYKGKESVLVAASNRTLNTASIFILDKETYKLSDFILNIPTSVNKIYGLCMHKDSQNHFYVIVNGKDGNVEGFQVMMNTEKIAFQKVLQAKVNSQPEGMVVDDENGILYIGVEEEAIFYLERGTHEFVQIPNSTNKSTHITYDIEGLAIFKHKGKKYLIVSSQGSFSYAIYNITNHKQATYVSSFIIKDGNIDGVEETDGLEAVSHPLNDTFKQGLIVFQDGFNKDNGVDKTQNFKFLALEKIFPFLK